MEITEKKCVFGEIPPETLTAWNREHKVKEITVTRPDKTKVTGYFIRPDFPQLVMVSKFLEDDPVRAMALLYDDCLLGGDPAYKDELSVKMAAAGELMKEIQSCAAVSKNL